MQDSIFDRLLWKLFLRKFTIMKKLFYISLLVGLYSCGPRMYSYKFSMKESKEVKKLRYENDTLLVSFNFYAKGIKMDFTNKSDSVVSINWNEVKMTENDIEKRVICIKHDKRKLKVVESPSLISPKAKISGLLVYDDNVYYSKKQGKEVMTIKDMYPAQSANSERKSVEKLVGTKIKLKLPLDINNTSHNKTFNFSIEEIQSARQFNGGEFLLLPLYILGGF